MRGKNLKMIAADIAEGYVSVNPLYLKPFDKDSLKLLLQEVVKKQTEIRSEKFPYSDIEAIRYRNMRLQKLHMAASIIKTFARERGILLV